MTKNKKKRKKEKKSKNGNNSNNIQMSMQFNALSERKTSTNKDILIAARHSMYEEMWTYSSFGLYDWQCICIECLRTKAQQQNDKNVSCVSVRYAQVFDCTFVRLA